MHDEKKTISVRNFPIPVWFSAMGKAKANGETIAAYLVRLILRDISKGK